MVQHLGATSALAAGALSDPQGRILLDLRVTGTATAPQVAWDGGAMRDRLAGKASQALEAQRARLESEARAVAEARLFAADEKLQELVKVTGEIPMYKAYSAAAKDYFWAHPMRFFATQAEHFIKLWRVLPHNRVYTHSYGVIALTALGSDGWLLPLALFGFWVKRRDPWVRWYFIPMVVSVTGAFSISQAPIRYRVPLMIIMLMLAGAGFEELLKRWRKSA